MCRNNNFETLVLFLSVSSFAVKVCRKGKMLKGRSMTVWKESPRLLPHRDKVGETNIRFYDFLPISELSIT